MTHHIQEICGFSLKKNLPTTIMYRDNQLQMKVSTRWLLLWTSLMCNLLATTRSWRIEWYSIMYSTKLKASSDEFNDATSSWMCFDHKDTVNINIWEVCVQDWRHHHKKLSDVLIRGVYYALHSFFLDQGFVPLGFLARFLTRQQIVRIKRYVYSFSFTRNFSHRIFF